ncbi:MAG: aminotransferase class IV [Opitutaceae bacterium]|nr:aminotransferase class IV [Opitutaceae bacterium]
MNSLRGLLDGTWSATDAPVLSLTSEAVQFGAGVFTTIGVRAGRPTWLKHHAARLQRDSARLGLVGDIPAGWEDRLVQVVDGNLMREGALKWMRFLDGGRTREWIFPRQVFENGFSAAPVSLISQVCEVREHRTFIEAKTLNYIHHWLATRAAREAGHNDVLWRDVAGRVLECGTGTFFAVAAGRLCTPPLAEGVLQGVARTRIAELGLGMEERTLPYAERSQWTECFFANAVMGVVPIRLLDGTPFIAPGPVTARVAASVEQDFLT